MGTGYFVFIIIPVVMVLWKVLGINKMAKKMEKDQEAAKAKKD